MNKNDGEVLVVGAERSSNLKEEPKLVDYLYNQIHARFPLAFAGLVEKYGRSRPNFQYFKYLCVRRFVMCNFGEYDIRSYDIEEVGKWNLEKVQCPMRGECRWEKTICQPTPGNCLSAHETDIVSLLVDGKSVEEIAESKCISLHTVRNHRRNIYRKLGIHNCRQLLTWYNNTITR